MPDKNDTLMSRKEFLKKTSAGLLTFGLLGGIPQLINAQKAQAKASLKYRVLGRTGIKVSPVGYGASRTMEPALIKSAMDTGINFLDTGRVYFNGQNEAMVGKAVKGVRKEVVIQSRMMVYLKKKGEQLKSAKVSENIKKMMQSSLSESLNALRTDYIDIMLIHGAKSLDIINHETVMEFFSAAKKKGQIRACGFTSHDNQVELLKSANKSKFYDVIMVPYNHKGSYRHSMSDHYREWDQPALESEMKKAEKNNIGIVAMKTCSAGPYSPDGKITPSYQEGLKWILSHSYINTMAVAMGNMKEINENIRAMR